MGIDAILGDKVVPPTPLNVEESRAQRQQRSQARFRDRGGIFIPSNRNLLTNILLGKAPPLTRRRSISASPSAHLQKGSQATVLRRISSPTKSKTLARQPSRSPQKQGRKSVHEPREKAASRPVNAKAPRKSIKGGAEGRKETDGQPVKPKPQPKRTSGGLKPASAPPEREPTVEEDIPKASKAKNRVASKKSQPTKASVSSHNLVSESTTTAKAKLKINQVPVQFVNPVSQVATLSSTSETVSKKPTRSRRKASDLYSGGSEDEYIPKVPKSRAKPRKSTSTSSKSAPKKYVREPPQAGPSKLADIMEEDEEGEELSAHRAELAHVPPASARQPEKSSSHSKRQPNVAEAKKFPAQNEQQDEAPSTPSAKRTISIRDADEVEESTAKLKAKRRVPAPTKMASKKRKAEESVPEEPGSAPPSPQPETSLSHTKKQTNASKNRKRRADDDNNEIFPIPPAKRARPVRNERTEESTAKHRAKRKATEPKMTAGNKRTREQEEEVVPEDMGVNPAKRKRATLTREKSSKPESVGMDAAKTRRVANAKKPLSKATAGRVAPTNGQKENVSVPTSILLRRGPPKSVLARLKALDSQPLMVDNEPDPIDFLS